MNVLKVNKCINNYSFLMALPFFFTIFSGCASRPSSLPLRSNDKTSAMTLRPYEEKILKNGLRIIFVQDDSLPRVSLSLLVKVGLAQEAIPGLNSLTAELLDKGTQKRSATEIVDELGSMGSTFSAQAGPDFTLFSSDALSVSAENLIKVFAEIIQKPAFASAEVDRERAQTLSFISRKKDDPSAMADDFYEELVFRGHPYQSTTEGTEKSVTVIRKKDIIQHYLNWYRPNNGVLAVVGALDGKLKALVLKSMEDWAPKNVASPALMEAAGAAAPSVLLYTKKGMPQTQVRMGLRGIDRKNPDYIALRLSFEVLGGSFASRLMQRVRDDLGLTYSIRSSVDARAQPGAFTISTFTKNETVKATILETRKIIEDFVSSGPTEKELIAAQNQLIGQFPRAVETSDRYATNLLGLDFYGVPTTYLTDFNRNVKSVQVGDIKRVLKEYVKLDKLKIAVYGDPEVEEQLQDLHPEVVRF